MQYKWLKAEEISMKSLLEIEKNPIGRYDSIVHGWKTQTWDKDTEAKMLIISKGNLQPKEKSWDNSREWSIT